MRPTSRCPARCRSYSHAPNQADTGIQKLVDSLINERGQSTGKKPGRCEMLEELIANGRFTALETRTP
ncbi:polymorphic toxin type 34 domain-containing protein [Salmonella enterica]|uniref:polymorphic toxin type 34 domain-containing protein n=1 Tax=Salmonella enterica TaxID=28901 RepID=UPI001600CAE7